MKKLIIMLVTVVVVLSGCSNQSKIATPPWDDEQIKQMESSDIKCVPFIIVGQ